MQRGNSSVHCALCYCASTSFLVIVLQLKLSFHLKVLTKNLECPSIGSFPVAGVCDYFVRCIQTEKGVEPEVDFCTDGSIYVVNRCIKSNNIHDCPQKMCTLAKPTEKTTPKTIFPSTSHEKPTMATSHIVKPIKTTKVPFLNLHPSLNEASTKRQLSTSFIFLFSILLLTINWM